MSNKFFHYSTNKEIEHYLSELTQQCGFKHKTQLINALFNGEVLTVQSGDLTLQNNQSALFAPNAQQLLDLDAKLRAHLSDTTPVEFDISQYQTIEEKISAAEQLSVRNKQFFPTYLHILQDLLLVFDFEIAQPQIQQLSEDEEFVKAHKAKIKTLAQSTSAKSKRRISVSNQFRFEKTMAQFTTKPLNKAQEEALSVINIAKLQLKDVALSTPIKTSLLQGFDRVKKKLTATQKLPSQLDKLLLLLGKAKFQRLTITELNKKIIETATKELAELNKQIKACHLAQNDAGLTVKQKVVEVVELEIQLKHCVVRTEKG
jgi:low affinity Fe/Cu permease